MKLLSVYIAIGLSGWHMIHMRGFVTLDLIHLDMQNNIALLFDESKHATTSIRVLGDCDCEHKCSIGERL